MIYTDRGTTLLRGLTNHGYEPLTSPGMILQVRGWQLEDTLVKHYTFSIMASQPTPPLTYPQKERV